MTEDFNIMVIEDSRVKILPPGSKLSDFYPSGTVIWTTDDEENWEEVTVPRDI